MTKTYYCIYCGRPLEEKEGKYTCAYCVNENDKEDVDFRNGFDTLRKRLKLVCDANDYPDLIVHTINSMIRQISLKLTNPVCKVIQSVGEFKVLIRYIAHVEEKDFWEVYKEIMEIGVKEILSYPKINKSSYEECEFELLLEAYNTLVRLKLINSEEDTFKTQVTANLKKGMSCVWIVYYLYLNKPFYDFNIDDLKEKMLEEIDGD